MIGYKVCYEMLSGRLYSYIRSPVVGGIEYLVDEWVYPKLGCGPLGVFTTLEAVLRYLDGRTCAVYRCKYDPSNETDIWDLGIRMPMSSAVQGYCDPECVALATRVKLLKREM